MRSGVKRISALFHPKGLRLSPHALAHPFFWGVAATVCAFVFVAFAPAVTAIRAAWNLDGGTWATLIWRPALLGRTVCIAALAAGLAVVIGAALAVLLCRSDLPGRRLILVVSLTPFFAPNYVCAQGWIYLLGDNGLAIQRLHSWLGWRPSWLTIYGPVGVVLLLALSYYPIPLAVVAASLRFVDGRLEEAALVRCSKLAVLWRITLPLIAPQIALSAVVVFLFAGANLGTPLLLRVLVYSVEIYTRASAEFDLGGAMAAALPLMGVAGGMILLVSGWASRRMSCRQGPTLTPRLRFDLARRRWVWTAICAAPFMLAIATPFAAILVKSGSPRQIVCAWRSGAGEIVNSLWFSAIASVISVATGWALAHVVRRLPARASAAAAMALLAPMCIPSGITAVTAIQMHNQLGAALGLLYNPQARLIVSYCSRYAPLAALVLFAGMAQMDRRLFEAARVHRVSWPRRCVGIEWPLLRPELFGAGVLVFALSFGDVDIAVLNAPPGMAPLSVRVFTLLHFGPEAMTAGLCLINLAAVGSALLIVLLVEDRLLRLLG